MSQSALQALQGQIEAELYRSEIYRQTVASLQAQLGDAAALTQMLVAAVAKEAIRLALKQCAENCGAVPAQSSQALQPAPFPAQPAQPAATGGLASVAGSARASAAPETAERARIDRLRQIGQELQQARQARELSLEQLERQILVPRPILEALETGRTERLPEDIYVRGFIRRTGDALGLDGSRMAASVPAPAAAQSAVPSWYRPELQSEKMRPAHLYLGYAALMAGAVGGLSWLSAQANPRAVAEPDPNFSSPGSVSHPDGRTVPVKTPGLRTGYAGVAAGSDIAPPEAMAY
ncbi:helix-turn-helix domain-containing protein [Kamptonema formosum]|uniref:helix-turn-helix domain-containing protein n=1 Tax=Kamptonema formosum TaxID=331992 RepID=UPI000348D423|nr:helix-turn-helix domain-containing protein [Oscillatoria sp. PCC 10802]